MTKPKVDPEFQSLIPPLTTEERAQLEANLLADGCRDPLTAWRGILLDGHNRLEICDANGIAYKVVEVKLTDRTAATAWVIRNQLGRRNLSDYQRAELALKLKPALEAEARERMKAGRNGDPSTNSDEGQNPQKPERKPPLRTDDAMADAAGVGRETMRKAEVIATKAAEPVKQMAREGKVSVRAAAAVATLPKGEQRRVAAEGPKAVKDKAKELLDGPKVELKPGAPPWAEFETGVRRVMSSLRSAARDLGAVLQYDAATKQLRCKWAHYYSHAGTVGQINAVVRNLEINLPAATDPKAPGFIPVRSMKSREAAAAGK